MALSSKSRVSGLGLCSESGIDGGSDVVVGCLEARIALLNACDRCADASNVDNDSWAFALIFLSVSEQFLEVCTCCDCLRDKFF